MTTTLTLDSIRDKRTTLQTNIIFTLIKEKMLSKQTILNDGHIALHLEELIKAGLPMSAQYPAYWSGASPGARACALLPTPMRPVYSRKTLLISFIPMTPQDINMLLTRVVQQRRRENKKSADTRVRIRDLVDKISTTG